MTIQPPTHPSPESPKPILRAFLPRLALFLLLLTLCQLLVGHLVPYTPDAGNPSLLQNSLDQDRPSVLFLGDSVMRFADRSDASAAGIATLFRKAAEYRVEPILIAQGGMHMDAFRHYAKLAATHPNKPKAVFIEINPAGLTDITHPFLYFRADSMTIYGMLHPWARPFLHPLAVFRHPMTKPGVSMQDYYRTPVRFRKQVIGHLHEYGWNNPKYRKITTAHQREKILTRYFCEPKSTNFKIRAIGEIARTLHSADIPAFFYVTPVDLEFCSQYWPGLFAHSIHEKVNVVSAQLEGTDARLIDMSFDLPHSAFSYADYPNEHLKLVGRGHVAQVLADASKDLF
ncbi:MAG: hypothetical protein PHG55_00900 [Verrucomicrobiota bacterium]|nr:hypothetical protein [Verrucomicrobiota bacterium]